jgi:hypothetical protein
VAGLGWIDDLRRALNAGRGAEPSDSAFVLGDIPTAALAQQERMWSLVHRGRRTLLIAAALMLGALMIATARGYASWSSAGLVVVALALAGVFTLADGRMRRRPPGTIEVPTDLAELIGEIRQVRDEIAVYGPDLLEPVRYERVIDTVVTHVREIVASSSRVLVAERAGDRDTSAALRADIERRFAAVADIYDDLELDVDVAIDAEAEPVEATPADDGPTDTPRQVRR